MATAGLLRGERLQEIGAVDRMAGRVALRSSALVLGAWVLACGVIGPGFAAQFPVRSYTRVEGLADDHVQTIVRDSRGYLWFCTAEGLSRFDGYRFTNFGIAQGLPGSRIADLLEAHDGSYWVATDHGLARFDPGSNPPRFVLQPLGEDGTPKHPEALIEDSGGRIWVGARDGLYQIDRTAEGWRSRFVILDVEARHRDGIQIHTLFVDKNRDLWIGSRWGGLYRRRSDGRIDRFTVSNGLPADHITSLAQDRDGALWVGTLNRLCRLVRLPDPARSIVEETYSTAQGLPSNGILSLLATSEGALFVGTNEGLAEILPARHGAKSRLIEYEAKGPTGRYIAAMAADIAGNLWLATFSHGVKKIVHDGFTTYDVADGLAHPGIASIFEDRAGELCAMVKLRASEIVVHRLEGRRFHSVRLALPTKNAGWGDQQVVAQAATGEWWVATGYGLARFPASRGLDMLTGRRPRAIYTTRDGLVGNDVIRLFEDSRVDLWISAISGSSARGVTRWDHALERFQTYASQDGYALDAPNAFAEDPNGSVWIGGFSGGVTRYAAGTFHVVPATEGVLRGTIRDLHFDATGRLWIASDLGAARLDDAAGDHPRIVQYTTAEGLASNEVRCVTEDQWGRIYLGTLRGVDRLDLRSGSIKHYTTADGLRDNFANVGFRDRKGDLWFGGPQGLARLVPKPDVPIPPPPIYISGLRIAGVERPLSLIGEKEVIAGRLPTAGARVELDYLGLDFGLGNVLRYQYKLEGSDADWSPPSEVRTVHYANLGTGRYRFLVRALDPEGRASPSPASVVFDVLPPVWRRWWFLTLVGLGVAGAVATVVRSRLSRLLEMERIRTRIATDLHDDVGATLSQIAVLSEVARRKTETDPAEVSGRLDRIAGAAREMVDSMSDIVWSIDPQRDHLSDLTNRMRRFAVEYAEAAGIELRFAASPPKDDVVVGADLRRQVLLIFKEAVNNAVRHSHCTEIAIEFRIEKDWLALTVDDNGDGFEPATNALGHGLASMGRRAQAMGGTWEIASALGKGTRIELRVPLGRRGRADNPSGGNH